jgi:hypothetical protein
MTGICNQMIVPCNILVHMVIVDDDTNNFDVNTLRTVSIEYNRIPSRMIKKSQIYTNWDANRLPSHQYVR